MRNSKKDKEDLINEIEGTEKYDKVMSKLKGVPLTLTMPQKYNNDKIINKYSKRRNEW